MRIPGNADVMRHGAAALLALLALSLMPAAAWAQAGFMAETSGEATIRRADGTVVALQPGELIQVGAEISTGPTTELTVKLADGQVLRLAPGTRIVLRQYQFSPQNLSASVSQVAVLTGAVRVVSGAIGVGNPGGLRIEVGGTVIRGATSGAEMIVSTDPALANGGSVVVVSGTVAVGNASIGQGQYATVQSSQLVRPPVPIAAAPAVIQGTVNGLRDDVLPSTEPVVVASAARAAAALAAAEQARAAAAANPGNAQLQAAALAAAQLAAAASQQAIADSTALGVIVSAAIIASLPAPAAGETVVDASQVLNGTPSVSSCVGSPC
jgi:hypothetical protein